MHSTLLLVIDVPQETVSLPSDGHQIEGNCSFASKENTAPISGRANRHVARLRGRGSLNFDSASTSA
jgi:hypothetical protein